MITGYSKRLDLERALRGYIKEGSVVSGVYTAPLVIPGNEHSPAPETPYVTLLLEKDNAIGTPVERFDYDANDDILRATTRQARRAQYVIQWLREGDSEGSQIAQDAADSFVIWCRTELGVAAANQRGFRLMSCGDATRMDEVEPSEDFEMRFVVELVVDYFQDREYDVQYVGSPTIAVHG